VEEILKNIDAEKMAFWRPIRPGEVIYELVDVVEEPSDPEFAVVAAESGPLVMPVGKKEMSPDISDIMTGMMMDDHRGLTDETCRMIATTVERVAREMIPAIAERVIREEIEKLKSETG
jgi:hypothetical protein